MKGRGFGRTSGRGSGREEAHHAHEEQNGQNGPDGPLNDLTGNGIVNNGPENEPRGLGRHLGDDNGAGKGAESESGGGAGSAGAAGGAGGASPLAAPAGGDGQGSARSPASFLLPPAGAEEDEQALRALFHTAVEDLEPSDGALDHLRRAVPTRRARKRQALVGVAAAVLLCGTAIPAFVHVANSGGSSDGDSVIAGHGRRDTGGSASGKESGGVQKDTDHVPGKHSENPDKPGETVSPSHEPTGEVGGGTGEDQQPGGTFSASSPVCDPGQLNVTGTAGAPEADGTVYGTFRVSNVSTARCSVSGQGKVNITAAGAAQESKIAVVDHTAGDVATGLPDPSEDATEMVLTPNSSYEVRFAWVPKETCPTTGTSPDPTPSENVTSGTGPGGNSGPGAGAGGSDTDPTNTDTQLVTDDGPPVEGSVTVSHTAEPGSPSGGATIPNACAGTIYRTGVLAPST